MERYPKLESRLEDSAVEIGYVPIEISLTR